MIKYKNTYSKYRIWKTNRKNDKMWENSCFFAFFAALVVCYCKIGWQGGETRGKGPQAGFVPRSAASGTRASVHGLCAQTTVLPKHALTTESLSKQFLLRCFVGCISLQHLVMNYISFFLLLSTIMEQMSLHTAVPPWPLFHRLIAQIHTFFQHF